MLSYTGRLSPSGIEWFSTRPLGAATPGGHFLFDNLTEKCMCNNEIFFLLKSYFVGASLVCC